MGGLRLPGLHADETGWVEGREEGRGKRAWHISLRTPPELVNGYAAAFTLPGARSREPRGVNANTGRQFGQVSIPFIPLDA
jgi:hypothetical protein